jgi:transcriptional regulator with XRE-family HTH domain
MNKEMFSFKKLLKAIREEADLTQVELAKSLGVSKVYIGMLESDMREPSRDFVKLLALKLKLHPSCLAPFIYYKEGDEDQFSTYLEQRLIKFGLALQEKLVRQRARLLEPEDIVIKKDE